MPDALCEYNRSPTQIPILCITLDPKDDGSTITPPNQHSHSISDCCLRIAAIGWSPAAVDSLNADYVRSNHSDQCDRFRSHRRRPGHYVITEFPVTDGANVGDDELARDARCFLTFRACAVSH